MTAAHPAVFSAPIVTELRQQICKVAPPKALVLDPFAGVGGIHVLADDGFRTVGIEIEPEWAEAHPRTICGDATRLPFPNHKFDVVATSPTYGNRMADHHEARDGSKRHTYRHTLGRPLNGSNSGGMQFGPAYCALHRTAWAEAQRVLKPGGHLILNVSDHVRKGQVVGVTDWHVGCLTRIGFEFVKETPIPTRRQRHGANGDVRVDHESVIVLRLT